MKIEKSLAEIACLMPQNSCYGCKFSETDEKTSKTVFALLINRDGKLEGEFFNQKDEIEEKIKFLQETGIKKIESLKQVVESAL